MSDHAIPGCWILAGLPVVPSERRCWAMRAHHGARFVRGEITVGEMHALLEEWV